MRQGGSSGTPGEWAPGPGPKAWVGIRHLEAEAETLPCGGESTNKGPEEGTFRKGVGEDLSDSGRGLGLR